MDQEKKIVIVGGAAAGVEAARAIAEAGMGHEAMLLTAEPRLPYKRTKVSKTFAAGFQPNAFALQERGWWRERGFDLRLGVAAIALDPAARTVALDDGSVVRWERLVLATGARARRLRLGPVAAGRVHHAHTIRQVEALRAEAAGDAIHTALVVGAGAMGVEVAEQLHRMGKEVTLTGDTAAPLAEELNAEAQAMLSEAIQQGGISLRCGQTVERVEAGHGAGLAVSFAGAPAPEAYDLVVSCAGTELRVDLARRAGLEVDRGVKVDSHLRTSCPDIFAAGDTAQHPGGGVTYLWRHAMEQGRVAGLNALGSEEEYAWRPFRLKVKVFGGYFFALGRPAPDREHLFDIIEQRGPSGRYLCAYYQGGRLAGLVMVNDGEHQKRYNQAVVEGWDRQRFEAEFF